MFVVLWARGAGVGLERGCISSGFDDFGGLKMGMGSLDERIERVEESVATVEERTQKMV